MHISIWMDLLRSINAIVRGPGAWALHSARANDIDSYLALGGWFIGVQYAEGTVPIGEVCNTSRGDLNTAEGRVEAPWLGEWNLLILMALIL